MRLQGTVNATYSTAPCVGGGVPMRVRCESPGGFAHNAKCAAAARGGMSALAETKLVAAAKRGDQMAFRELVERHKKRVYLHAFGIMGNSEDAEDVRQLAFLKAFLHLPKFKGESSFSTWITRIAINEALMMRRRCRRGREVPIDDAIPAEETAPAAEIVDARPNPEHWYAQLEWREILNSALSAIRPALRLALLMYGIDELSTRQTAEMLGISVSAAKSRINRGRRALRDKIRRHLASAGAAESELQSTLGSRPVTRIGSIAGA